MQYLFPVGFGPSSNKCPRCPPHLAQTTSTLFIPKVLSSLSSTFPLETTSQKLGHPLPESNLVSDEKVLGVDAKTLSYTSGNHDSIEFYDLDFGLQQEIEREIEQLRKEEDAQTMLIEASMNLARNYDEKRGKIRRRLMVVEDLLISMKKENA